MSFNLTSPRRTILAISILVLPLLPTPATCFEDNTIKKTIGFSVAVVTTPLLFCLFAEGFDMKKTSMKNTARGLNIGFLALAGYDYFYGNKQHCGPLLAAVIFSTGLYEGLRS